MTMLTEPVRNGVDTSVLFATLDAIKRPMASLLELQPKTRAGGRLVASLLAATAMSLGTVAWASAQTVTSDASRQSGGGCPDPKNCTVP
jgi:hypothetical protein